MRTTTIECPECGCGVRLEFVDGAIVTGKADIEVTGLHYPPVHSGVRRTAWTAKEIQELANFIKALGDRLVWPGSLQRGISRDLAQDVFMALGLASKFCKDSLDSNNGHSKDVGEPIAKVPRHKWAQGRSND